MINQSREKNVYTIKFFHTSFKEKVEFFNLNQIRSKKNSENVNNNGKMIRSDRGVVGREARLRLKAGQIGPKWDKSGNF